MVLFSLIKYLYISKQKKIIGDTFYLDNVRLLLILDFVNSWQDICFFNLCLYHFQCQSHMWAGFTEELCSWFWLTSVCSPGNILFLWKDIIRSLLAHFMHVSDYGYALCSWGLFFPTFSNEKEKEWWYTFFLGVTCDDIRFCWLWHIGQQSLLFKSCMKFLNCYFYTNCKLLLLFLVLVSSEIFLAEQMGARKEIKH